MNTVAGIIWFNFSVAAICCVVIAAFLLLCVYQQRKWRNNSRRDSIDSMQLVTSYSAMGSYLLVTIFVLGNVIFSLFSFQNSSNQINIEQISNTRNILAYICCIFYSFGKCSTFLSMAKRLKCVLDGSTFEYKPHIYHLTIILSILDAILISVEIACRVLIENNNAQLYLVLIVNISTFTFDIILYILLTAMFAYKLYQFASCMHAMNHTSVNLTFGRILTPNTAKNNASRRISTNAANMHPIMASNELKDVIQKETSSFDSISIDSNSSPSKSIISLHSPSLLTTTQTENTGDIGKDPSQIPQETTQTDGCKRTNSTENSTDRSRNLSTTTTNTHNKNTTQCGASQTNCSDYVACQNCETSSKAVKVAKSDGTDTRNEMKDVRPQKVEKMRVRENSITETSKDRKEINIHELEILGNKGVHSEDITILMKLIVRGSVLCCLLVISTLFEMVCNIIVILLDSKSIANNSDNIINTTNNNNNNNSNGLDSFNSDIIINEQFRLICMCVGCVINTFCVGLYYSFTAKYYKNCCKCCNQTMTLVMACVVG